MMNHRSLRHFAGFALALAVILGGSTLFYANRASRYASHLQSIYQSALSQMMGSLSSMDTALEKTPYASDAMRQSLAADIWRESSSAAALLSSLPVSSDGTEALSAYLSKTADFAHYLLRSELYGGDGASQWDTLSALRRNSREMLNALAPLKEQLDAGELLFPDPVLPGDGTFEASLTALNDGFPACPSLNYDGACSDHMASRTASALAQEKPASREECEKSAKKLLGAQAEFSGACEGRIPAYLFTDGERTAFFSKAGGMLLSFCDPRDVGKAQMAQADAIRSAEDFVKSIGLTTFRSGDSTMSGGVCTVVLSDAESGAKAYGDSVRVGVAMDNGDVVRFDASDYLMNHKARLPESPAFFAADARALLDPELSVASEEAVYRLSAGQQDVLCWEYVCNDESDGSVVYYINCETGQIEALELLTETENGTLRR